MRRIVHWGSLALLALAVVAADTSVAAAPRNAKAAGASTSGFWGNSAGRSIRHASDYSKGFRNYASQAERIDPKLLRQEADGVGQNIVAAQRQFTSLRRSTNDQDTLTSLATIDVHLADAAKGHAIMQSTCDMPFIEGKSTMKCCDDVDAALAKAAAEHAKLMQHIQARAPAPVVVN